MTRILFVCHGNICRSPMAEFIFKKLIKDAHRENDFYVESAATSTEELGNPVYPPAREELLKHGIDPTGKHSRRMTKSDYEEFDYIFIMDENNARNIKYIIGEDVCKKVYKLLDFAEIGGDVPDPWYYGNYDTVYNTIYSACNKTIEKLS